MTNIEENINDDKNIIEQSKNSLLDNDFYKDKTIFCGYASVFNVVDNQNEVVLKEAVDYINNVNDIDIPILWQHDAKKPIGRVITAYTDDVGLFIYGYIDDNLFYGKEAKNAIKSNIINSMSIGYKLNKYCQKNNIDKQNKLLNNIDEKTFCVNYLQDIKIVEISVVSLPANSLTCIKILNN